MAMATGSSSSSPSFSAEVPRRQGGVGATTSAFADFIQQAEEDNVVCAFGPNYFRGASLGACGGSFFTGLLCWYTFRMLKADQREVDFLSGLRRGQRNRHFSSWTLLRGLRTQPMLTVGCVALGATSVMKCTKCYLASLRCREFYRDDMDFALLQSRSRVDSKAAALLEAVEREVGNATAPPISPLAIKSAAVAQIYEKPSSATTTTVRNSLKPGASVQDLLNAHDSNRLSTGNSIKLIHRCPSFWDGVAVAFFGSVMDCYLPQKPVQKYYNMHVGLW